MITTMNTKIAMKKLEDILTRNLTIDQLENEFDLTDDDCEYRANYFDYLENKEDFLEAWQLYPEHEFFIARLEELEKCEQKNRVLGIYTIPKPELIKKYDICIEVERHLKSILPIMDAECNHIIKYLNNNPKIVEAPPDVNPPQENILHTFVYGTIADFLVDNMPDEDPYWMLYDWAINRTKLATVAAYLLYPCFKKFNLPDDIFDAGFHLWQMDADANYWIKDNDLNSPIIYCNK